MTFTLNDLHLVPNKYPDHALPEAMKLHLQIDKTWTLVQLLTQPTLFNFKQISFSALTTLPSHKLYQALGISGDFDTFLLNASKTLQKYKNYLYNSDIHSSGLGKEGFLRAATELSPYRHVTLQSALYNLTLNVPKDAKVPETFLTLQGLLGAAVDRKIIKVDKSFFLATFNPCLGYKENLEKSVNLMVDFLTDVCNLILEFMSKTQTDQFQKDYKELFVA